MKWKTIIPHRRGTWVTRWCIFPRKADDGYTYWFEKIRVLWPARKIVSEAEYQEKYAK